MSRINTLPHPRQSDKSLDTKLIPPTAAMGLASLKIHNCQLERVAEVYVRQSEPQQIVNHRESRELQYALVDRAVALGWPRERVVVIDDDTGTTATTAEH